MSSHPLRRTARLITTALPLASSVVALVAALVPHSSWAQAPVPTGQWLFEEGTGTTALNSGSLGPVADGTLTGVTGTPTYVPGLYQGSSFALRFNSDGTTIDLTKLQKVSLPNNLDLVRNAPGATIMAWVKLEGNAGGTVTRTICSISNNDTTANGGQGATRANLQTNNTADPRPRALGRPSDVSGGANTSATAPAAQAMVIGQTYFLTSVFEYSGSAVRIYINGVQAASAAPAWTANCPDTANLTSSIGSNSPPSASAQESWPGIIDGLRVYNSVFSAADILATYNAELLPTANADFDGQDPVDGNDFAIWQRNLGTPGRTLATGDSDNDGDADATDLANWRSHFGLNSAVGAAGAVPEPATAGLMIAAGLALGSIRRRRLS